MNKTYKQRHGYKTTKWFTVDTDTRLLCTYLYIPV